MNAEIKSSNKKVRFSNIELLRIISMFFILVLHANFYAFSYPEIQENSKRLITMSFLESFCIVAVNVFVLISGYFGIRTSNKGLVKFIFQCLFYSCGIYIIFVAIGLANISVSKIADCFYLHRINWFPKAYLCLYILAPVFNAFIEKSSKEQVRKVIIGFFVFQTIFGCISDATAFISFGYSTISFMGLYLLARYVRLYPSKWFSLSPIKDFFIYVGISIILSILHIWAISSDLLVIDGRINAYSNPLVIISSLYLLLCFSKIKIQSSIINKVALSCFAVYLLHANPNITGPFYISPIRYIFENTTGFFSILYITFFLIIVYIIAVVVDQVRLFCWRILLSLKDRIVYKMK